MQHSKSFLYNFMWVGIMLLVMGILFGAVGVVVQLLPLAPDQISYYHNGVQMPPTQETLRSFKALFLYLFGGFGVVMLTIGGILLGRNITAKKRCEELRARGVPVYAKPYESTPSNITVNNRRLMRLRCIYNDSSGTAYVFKSGLLRADPTPFLQDGRVLVYYDQYQMDRYFVDIDGSIAAGARIVEL